MNAATYFDPMNNLLKQFFALVIIVLFIFSCRPKISDGNTHAEMPLDSLVMPKVEKIKIFLENSKSMGGYYKGSTQFTDNIDSYLVGLEKGINFKGLVEPYTISEKIKLYDNLDAFRNDFNPRNGNKIATATSSPLDDILSRVYDATSKGEISIVITDGIPSGSNEEVRKIREFNFLNKVKLKNDISISLDGIKEKGYAVMVKQGVSNFLAQRSNKRKQNNDHPYYFLDNSTFPQKFGTEKIMSTRPYYLIYVGDRDLINQLEQKISFTSSNSVCFNCIEEIEVAYCKSYKSINNVTYKGNKLNIKGRLGRGKNSSNRFAYLINKGSSYSNQSADALTLDFKDHTYIIIDKGIDTIFVSECLTVKEAKKRGICGSSQKNINQFSHILLFEDDAKMGRKQKYTLEIGKNIPSWINDFHTDDDRDIMPGKSYEDFDKTFGLKFLVDGINKAFSIEKSETIFTKPLN